jgi:hypothetical protein
MEDPNFYRSELMHVVIQKNGRLIVYEGDEPTLGLSPESGEGTLQEEFMHEQLKLYCTEEARSKIKLFLDLNVLFAGINMYQNSDTIQIEVFDYGREGVKITGEAFSNERQVKSTLGNLRVALAMKFEDQMDKRDWHA